MSLASLFERSLNHLLHKTPGAAPLLAQQAGKCMRFYLGVAQLDLLITPAGQFSATQDATPDATVRAHSDVLLKLPFLGREALRHAEYSGDPALLQALDQVFQVLRWDIEAELAPWLGDIAAQRLASVAQRGAQGLRDAAQAIQTSGSEYIVEEIAMLARKSDVARFCVEVDTLVDDSARLEARLARLEASSSNEQSTPPQP